MRKVMQRKWNGLALFILGFSALWAALLAWNLAPQLRGDYGWRWPYEVVNEPLRLLPLVIVLLIYLAGVWRLWSRRARWLLLWSFVAALALTWAVLFVRSDPFFEMSSVTLAGVTGGWHFAAARITDMAAALRDWPSVMERSIAFSSHMGISPPGMVVMYSAATHLLDSLPGVAQALAEPLRAAQCANYRLLGYSNAEFASAWLGILMPVWGALTVLPLYVLGRRLFDEQTARWSVMWWPLLPGFLMFAPLPNMFYPLPTVMCVLWLISGLQRGQLRWVLAAAILTSFLTFLTFTFMPLLLFELLLIGGLWLRQRQLAAGQQPSGAADGSFRWLLRMLIGFAGGLIAVWVVIYLISGASFFDVFRAALGAHLNLDRPYLPWLILHPNDFFMFTGWPITLLAFVGIGSSVGQVWRTRMLTPAHVLTFALSLTVLALNFSGTLRGEAGRILVFMAPFWLLVAGSALSAAPEPARRRVGRAATAAEAVLLVVMVAVLEVVSSGFAPPPAAPPLVGEPPPTSMIASTATFGDRLYLNGFVGQIDRAQSALIVWLEWTADGQVDVPYYLSLLPVSPSGQVASAATLLQPFAQKYPTTCWRPANGQIRDRLVVPLTDATEAGEWWISLALVNGDTGVQLPVRLGDGTQDNQVGIGPFR
jgi:hypothetical protein